MKRYIATLLLLAICASTQAREVFPLNEGWRFFFKSENSSDNARHVTLPHTWNTDTGGTGYFLETTANYQNDMYIPAEWATKRLFVKFYGVQSVADVFVNGYYVGGHKGGGTAFALEITDKIRFGSDNALLVVVSNNYCDDVLPTSTDMNLYGGIYREAELILTEKTAVSPLYLGSDGILVHQNSVGDERVEGEAEIHLVTGGENSCVLTLDITAPDGSRVFSKRQKTRIDGKPVTIPFSVDAPQLWSPANPALYRVSVSIGDATVTDSVAVRTGFRSIVATPAGGFAVNGSRIPGAEDLITVRGMHMLQQADVIIYAGSLVNPELLQYAKTDCEIHNSAKLTLEEVLQIMQEAQEQGKMLVRLHTGEPSIYGAVREQMDALDALHIPYESCPGVSACFGAAASLNLEYTLPGVSQTLIITRMEGRTGDRKSVV